MSTATKPFVPARRGLRRPRDTLRVAADVTGLGPGSATPANSRCRGRARQSAGLAFPPLVGAGCVPGARVCAQTRSGDCPKALAASASISRLIGKKNTGVTDYEPQ
ncbi:hypothetical protein GCM10028832_22780 [Streptomyces sparsus]